jgi:hypothetical protein
MLVAINTIMIFILVAVVITNMVLLFQFRDNVRRRMDEINSSVLTSVDTARLAAATAAVTAQKSITSEPTFTPISVPTPTSTPSSAPTFSPTSTPNFQEQRPSSFNLLDHDEFSKMNPEVKDIYKQYFVQGLMPRFMDKLNKEVLTPNAINNLRTQGQELVALDDATLFGSSPSSVPK